MIVLTLMLQIKRQINLHDGLSDGMRFKLSNGGITLDFHNKTMVVVVWNNWVEFEGIFT